MSLTASSAIATTGLKNASNALTNDQFEHWYLPNFEMQFVIGTQFPMEQSWVVVTSNEERQEVNLTNSPIIVYLLRSWLWNRPWHISDEFTEAERAELRRKYEQSQEHPMTLEQARRMPNLLDPDFG